MNDFLETVKEWIKYRTSSVLYWTFAVSWLLTNWKIWYISFFVSEEYIFNRFWILKVEYIENIYRISWWYGVGNIFLLIIIPWLAVYSIHWWLSKLETKVYKKSEENKSEKRRINAKQEIEYRKSQKFIETEKWQTLDIEEKNINKEKVIEESKSIEQLREEEYDNLKSHAKTKLFTALEQLQTSYYTYNWLIYSYDDYEREIIVIENESVVFLDIYKLWRKSWNSLEITDKWRFFLEKYFKEWL